MKIKITRQYWLWKILKIQSTFMQKVIVKTKILKKSQLKEKKE